MTRGRKKDLTIPPTRALVQQRDYRARKAHYVADLEERVRKVEAENIQLRKDLEAARTGLATPSTPLNPQIVEASRDLMQHLSLATSSLGRFQHLAFPEGMTYPPPLPPLQLPPLPGLSPQSCPASFPSPAPSPPFSQVILHSPSRTVAPASTASLSSAPPLTASASYPSGRKRLYREDSPDPPELPRIITNISPCFDNTKRSTSPESECCGGILDCRDLIEEDRDKENNDQPTSRLSVIRSTSEQSYGREDRF
ncbi:hypothetical protein AN958_04654 [Leucoagaricus sp. SymC.cos]|nr:hypothetical protein AN958_04654 [Leucoagaricus sp. SymC.cos]